jgi:hypothetical protein
MRCTDLLAKMNIVMFAQKSSWHNALQEQMTHLQKSIVYAFMFCNWRKVYSNPEVCNLPSMHVSHATIWVHTLNYWTGLLRPQELGTSQKKAVLETPIRNITEQASLFNRSLLSESMICSSVIVNVLANAPLRPVFKDVGSSTAGNSCSISYSHLLDYLFPLPLSLTLFMFFQSTNRKDTLQVHLKSKVLTLMRWDSNFQNWSFCIPWNEALDSNLGKGKTNRRWVKLQANR